MVERFKKLASRRGVILFAGMLIAFCIYPAMVMADITNDLKAGISLEETVENARTAGIASEDIAKQLAEAGILPDKAAAAVAKAVPEKAADVAAAVATVYPKAAADIATAVVKEYPEAAMLIVIRLKAINPDQAEEIQNSVDQLVIALRKEKRSLECESYDPICQYCENGRVLNNEGFPCSDGDVNTEDDICGGGKCRGKRVTSPTNPGVWISID